MRKNNVLFLSGAVIFNAFIFLNCKGISKVESKSPDCNAQKIKNENIGNKMDKGFNIEREELNPEPGAETILELKPPLNVKAFETSLATMWFETDSVFCLTIKPGLALTKETLISSFDFIKTNSSGKKVCWLIDVTKALPPEKDVLDFATKEGSKVIKGLSMIANSVFTKMTANIMLSVKKLPYPAKVFTKEKDAKAWLKKYM